MDASFSVDPHAKVGAIMTLIVGSGEPLQNDTCYRSAAKREDSSLQSWFSERSSKSQLLSTEAAFQFHSAYTIMFFALTILRFLGPSCFY